jgi:hypothetical protein
MAEYRCGECGKVYKSQRWLRRHQRQVHANDGVLPLPLDDAEGEGTAEAAEASAPVEPFGPKVLERALVDLGIDRENVVAHRVYPDRVVVIEGPVGFKRVWMMPGREPASGAG